jgi:hypothetical protein
MYHQEIMPEVLEAIGNLDALGEELNVKLHSFTTCSPAHVFFLLLEADTLSAVDKYVFSIPMPQQIDVVPVEDLSKAVAMAKEATAQD